MRLLGPNASLEDGEIDRFVGIVGRRLYIGSRRQNLVALCPNFIFTF
jgi:hypothetical protein